MGNTSVEERGQSQALLRNGVGWAAGFPTTSFSNRSAVLLDGVDDYIELPVTALLALDRPKSICAWFWIASVPTVHRKDVVSLVNLNAAASIQLGLEYGFAAVWTWGVADPFIVSKAKLSLGWHHIVYTFDGTIQALYLDGTMVGTSSTRPPAVPATAGYLGAYDPIERPVEKFEGRIDDVRIYDRALLRSRISDLAAGAP
jgi:hypothetical protein